MNVLPDMAMITEGKVLVNETVYPVVEIEVENGYYSDQKDLDFEWTVIEMTPRRLKFQLTFKTARYVSMQEEPDVLRIIIRDPYLFVSTSNLAIGRNEEESKDSIERRLES